MKKKRHNKNKQTTLITILASDIIVISVIIIFLIAAFVVAFCVGALERNIVGAIFTTMFGTLGGFIVGYRGHFKWQDKPRSTAN